MAKLTGKIVRTIGRDTYEFTLEIEVSDEDKAKTTEYACVLGTKLHLAMNEHEKRISPHTKSAPQPEASGGGITEEIITVDTFDVSISHGKTLVKAKGGAWQKWGVPVYPEVASELPHDFENELYRGELDGKYAAVVQVYNGKAKKVLRFVKRVQGAGDGD